MNCPGTNGDALLKSVSRTGPGMTDCPFAALRPVVKIIRFSDFHHYVITSVPNVVRNTRGGQNLKRRFLHRVAHYGILIFILSVTNDRNHSPVRSLRGLHARVGLCDRSLTGRP